MAKAKKKAKKKSSSRGGIGSYIRKINNAPRVRAARKKVAAAEKKVKQLKRKKEIAVKLAQRAYKKKHKC